MISYIWQHGWLADEWEYTSCGTTVTVLSAWQQWIEEERKEEENRKEEDERKEQEEVPIRKFTLKEMTQAFSLRNQMPQMFETMDYNVERFARIERIIEEALRPYKEIYEEKKKRTVQTNLRMFIKTTTPARPPSPVPYGDSTNEEEIDDPQPSTSGM